MDALGVLSPNALNLPGGTTLERPSGPPTGSVRWNTEYNVLEVYTGTEWKGVNLSVSVLSGDIGVFGGGFISPTLTTSTIDYITISTLGNTLDFGDLNTTSISNSSFAGSTRGFFAGGYNPTYLNAITYVTISSTGSSFNFGNLTNARISLGCCSNSVIVS